MAILTCREIRNGLQEARDRGLAPPAEYEEHLASCAECRAFQKFLSSYADRLGRELEARTAAPAGPDGKRVAASSRARTARRRLVYALSGLAAAVVIGLGGLLAASLIDRERTEEYVREENSQFVDDLFSEPVLEGIEYLTVSE
jgi:predicted anti-sigma-YlaC factor YlaD